MEYYNLMFLVGCCILYIITNIYSVIIYIINTIKNGKFADIITAPLSIFMLLIPIIGTLFSFAIIDESNKYWQLFFLYRSLFNIYWFCNKHVHDILNNSNYGNIKIEVPNGYEIDKEKSTFENIEL